MSNKRATISADIISSTSLTSVEMAALHQTINSTFVFPTSAQSEEGSRSLLQAGHVIGVAERVMAFVFVLVQQYEALGFLIAAKSILRFGDKETARTEYVLVGTLLSYLIAVLSALCVGWLV